MNTTRNMEEVSETAALYAVGNLPESEARRFEQRIQSGCPYCVSELNQCQRAVEGLLAAMPVAAPEALEARLMKRIGRGPASPTEPHKSDAKIVRAGEGVWVDLSTPGVQFKMLHKRKTMLVKMEAGASYPSHSHAYDEQCIVLEGTIEDGEGNLAHTGDFVFMPKGSTHSPLFSRTGAVFLVAYT